VFAAQIEAANELGKAFAADEIARVKHRRAYDEAKAGCPRDPGVPPGQNQVVGKEVNKTTQQAAEGAVPGSSAAEATRHAPIHHDFDRVVHDWQFLPRVGGSDGDAVIEMLRRCGGSTTRAA
jgi:hypothetical protein